MFLAKSMVRRAYRKLLKHPTIQRLKDLPDACATLSTNEQDQSFSTKTSKSKPDLREPEPGVKYAATRDLSKVPSPQTSVDSLDFKISTVTPCEC